MFNDSNGCGAQPEEPRANKARRDSRYTNGRYSERKFGVDVKYSPPPIPSRSAARLNRPRRSSLNRNEMSFDIKKKEFTGRSNARENRRQEQFTSDGSSPRRRRR